MEPSRKIKKFNAFTEKKSGDIINFLPIPQEPRRQYRYLMEIPLGDRMFMWWVNCELPSFNMNYGRDGWDVRYGRGAITQDWTPIQIRFSHLTMGYEDEDIYLFNDRLRDWVNNGNKISTTIKRINNLGDVLDTWNLRGCFVSNVYYQTELDTIESQIEITLQYDYCRLN